jgi:tRNA(Ile)-lysidine synthase
MNKQKDLLQKFTEFNHDKHLANRKKKCLLTVSGGMDSMVMCDLFFRAGFPFAIAHCNFNLRGKESDGDEQLVKSLTKKYKVEVFTKSFATKEYVEQKNISIQLAARELRYAWFEELRKEKQLDLIATAHHLNDNIETIIYNLIKGTGIRGLRGIPVRHEHIIRPLLFASREEIAGYQKENALAFREDSSNADDKYTRNKIRHLLIPFMKEINPSLEKTFGDKIDLFTELEALYEKQVNKPVKGLFLQRKEDIYIPIAKLKKTKNAATILFEYLKDLGFNAEQVDDMLANLDSIPGKQFLTDKARIIKDRRFFILTQLSQKDFTTQLIQKDDTEIQLSNAHLKLSVVKREDLKISADKNLAFIDLAKLEFPLIVRHWKQGDYFYPFGMKMKKKKLKKFFTDQKVALNEKETIWVIESNQKIVWVAGHRMDERFKVGENTGEVLRVQLK